MKKIISIFFILLLMISVMPIFGEPTATPPATTAAKPEPKPTNEFYDMLLLGVDKRPHEKNGRSDVLMIIHCEPGRITFFSIPRDTVVQIGSGKRDKINAAYSWGNVPLAKKTFENFLKFKVDNYLVMEFNTFMTTIDVIKKLTDDGRLIGAENFLLSGENLLKWLRWRNLPGGDRRRAQRHQLFMKRIFEYTQYMYKNNPSLFGQCMKAGLKIVNTDLTYEHVEQLYETYKDINLETDIERYVLPGYGKSYTELNEETGKQDLTGWYYYPKYDWSLMTYLNWYRKNNMKMNYVEADTLRK